ncbi:MAG: PqqD family protein [Albidovulum sp.]|uniref:PqqD family protein n=1 Tax=Albidovulum sp. TaxID=1872424 RepID=UPI003C90F95D
MKRHDTPTQSAYIRFEGLNAPVLLDGCTELLEPLARIIPHWPYSVSAEPGDTEPTSTISRIRKGRYTIASLSTCGETREFNAVNAICDMIVELSCELLRSGEQLMCLHGAAVEISGRLVIIPNVRRAGKSTLTACLAHRGFRVFSDDFFSVGLDPDGRFQGVAMGVSPRLRLPVPESFSTGFRDWVSTNDGPANRQYKYLTLPDQPAHGSECPLGAIIFLNRKKTGPTTLEPMDMHKAVAALLHQNFARTVHSGTILHMTKALLSAVHPHRLTYSCAEEAAAFLETRFSDWPADPPVARNQHLIEFREVDEELIAAPMPEFHRDAIYVRKHGYSEVTMNGGHYLTDAFGLGVHRLNDGSLAIWRLLEEPMDLDDLCDVLAHAFPDAPRAQIEADSTKMLTRFVEHRLVEPAGRTG